MKKCLSLITLFAFVYFNSANAQNVEVIVLGVAQDAGYPQSNCQLECCTSQRGQKDNEIYISSLGIVDLNTNQYYLIDCTSDFKQQLHMMSAYAVNQGQLPNGIFLTHAHIGHYFGLAQLGKEVMNTSNIPVYAMKKMANFITSNGPWEQLASQENIDLKELDDKVEVKLSPSLSLTPIIVPHRDEYSETVGFLIKAASESLLYIPDIDKWERWSTNITDLIKEVDHAFIDGTFYANGELKNRDMKDIPHPFVEESIQKFSSLSALDKSKIHFIHFNHTNPLLNKKSLAYKSVYLNGFNVASQGLSIYLD